MSPPLLETRSVTRTFGGGLLSRAEPVVAVDQVDLAIAEQPATITTVAGESGSGKTTLANLILGFVAPSSGQILYRGRDITTFQRAERIAYRREVQAVFQDPYAVYNPFYRVRHIFDLAVRHLRLASSRAEARDLVEDALRMVGMRGEEVLDKHPHQLSGGQRQRMMVARAYLLRPRLIVADEPVSMVDASLRAMILDIMLRLRDEVGVSFLYITHDLSTAYQIGDQIFIMNLGQVVEHGDTVQVIEHPQHPYVKDLIASIPVPDPSQRWLSR